MRDYLLNYGSAGDFGPFHSEEPLACRRGDRVVVRSHRGQELGVIMRPATEEHARLLEGKFVGQILRLATPGDVELASRMQARSQSLFQDTRQLLAQLQLPMELLDAEVLLDGRQAVLHYLRWQECDPRPLMESLSQKYRLLVTLHDLALMHEVREFSVKIGNCAVRQALADADDKLFPDPARGVINLVELQDFRGRFFDAVDDFE